MASSEEQQMIEQFERAFQGDGTGNPCSVYLANAGNAGSLGNAIRSHFGAPAAAFYNALVQIARANCQGSSNKGT